MLAVYEAVAEALARGRAGEGPTFVEALTYRCAPHATADDPTAYWDAARVELERGNECFGRYERYLRRLGVLTDELAEEASGRGARADEGGDRRSGGAPPARSRARLRARVRPTRLRGFAMASSGAERRSWRRSTTRSTPRWSATTPSWSWARTSGAPEASSGRRRACATASAPTAAWTRRSRRRGSSARPSAWRWRAGARSARCSTSPSATPASTSSSATSAATAGARAGRWSSRSRSGCRPAEACARPSCTKTRRRPTTYTPRA